MLKVTVFYSKSGKYTGFHIKDQGPCAMKDLVHEFENGNIIKFFTKEGEDVTLSMLPALAVAKVRSLNTEQIIRFLKQERECNY